ncbi:MAG: nucleoside triphosphate pyrophosphohydrolase [Bacilli bacterium]|nr:nucleoside triphosphate pyrophosphohydrolase [Bacilli bacterium]
MSYNKLVRDKIPDIIKSNGEEPITRVLSEEEYKIELEKKLQEELNETLQVTGDDRIEELADMLEVMTSLAELEGKTLDDVIITRNEKKEARGGFQKRLYLKGVKEDK